jgi:cytochrome c-type biogenesis protein CcmH/NrfG
LSLNDTVADAHYLLGTIRRHQGRLAEAKASLETANRLNPNLIGVYAELARFYLAQGDIRKARWFLEEGLARSPQDRRLMRVQQELAGR